MVVSKHYHFHFQYLASESYTSTPYSYVNMVSGIHSLHSFGGTRFCGILCLVSRNTFVIIENQMNEEDVSDSLCSLKASIEHLHTHEWLSLCPFFVSYCCLETHEFWHIINPTLVNNVKRYLKENTTSFVQGNNLKMLSAKCRPFCPRLNVPIHLPTHLMLLFGRKRYRQPNSWGPSQ